MKKPRHLYLIGRVEDSAARDLIAQLLEEPNSDFVLFINSEGGSVYNELALCNLIAAHGRVDTVCLGVAMSAAATILASGRKRYILPNSVAMIHQISWEMGWQPSTNLAKNSRFLERLNRQLTELISLRTGQPIERICADVAEDCYLFGEEIIRYGLADEFWRRGEPERTGRPARRKLPPRRKR